MRQTRIDNPGWSHRHRSRRGLLQALGRAFATTVVLAVPEQGFAQTSHEIQAVDAWTKGGRSYVPPNGCVPDKKTAILVADAILTSVYGEQQIAKERPLKIALVEGDVWLIWGTLPRRYLGGTAVIKLSRRTGKVLFLSHGQ